MKTKYDWNLVHDDEIQFLAKNGYSNQVIGFYTKPQINIREELFCGEGNIQENLYFSGDWLISLEERPN